MNKIVKRILISLGAIIVLFLAAAVLIPILFKDKILAVVKNQMNEQLLATTDFKDINLSLFRSFPQLSVSIEEISIVGRDVFKNDTLLAAKSIDVSLDLMKAISGSYDITRIGLISPRIHALITEDGKANWDITKPDTATATADSKPFALKLRKYEVKNAYIEYHDRQGKTHLLLDGFNHSGSGDFSSDLFTLATQTTIEGITFASGNIPYMSKVKTQIDLDLSVDNKAHKYTFNTDKIQLNGLKMSFRGAVYIPDTVNTVIDMQFSTPGNDFKDFLSLVPGIYQNNFKDIKTTGKASFNGSVKGTYSATRMPAYNVNLNIQDGSFQYPDLPQKVSNIQLKLAVNNPDGITDHTVVDLQKGHIDFGTEPFDFRLLLKSPVSSQWIDASMKGKIDLSKMQQFMKMEAGTKLTGLINADVAIKGSMADAQKSKFDQLYAAGTIDLANIQYASKDYPDGVNLYSLLLTFNPKNVTASNMKGQYLQTIFSGSGSIDNLLGYYFHNEALAGSFNFTADKLDVNKWMGSSSTTTAAKADTPTVAFVVPDNLNVSVHATVGSVHYDNLTLADVSGGLVVRNQVVNLQNVTAKGLDGIIKMTGFYSTKVDKKHPDFQFDYTVENIDVQKTYNTFAFVQKMMPAGKYVNGKVSSTLSMAGKIGGDMSPMLNTISGKGNMMMLSGQLSNFPVTDQLAAKLNMPQLKSSQVKDFKLFFEFDNGRVVVQPYKLKLGNVDAEVAGSHGFDQTIKYGVNMNVPTAMMGAQGTNMVNGLLNQANSKGLNIKLGDHVPLAITITGTMQQPKIETNLKNVAGNAVDNVKQQIQEEVKKKVDSVKQVVKDTVKAVATQVVNSAKDELKKQLLGDTTTKKGNDAAKEVIKNAGDKVKEGLNGLFKRK